MTSSSSNKVQHIKISVQIHSKGRLGLLLRPFNSRTTSSAATTPTKDNTTIGFRVESVKAESPFYGKLRRGDVVMHWNSSSLRNASSTKVQEIIQKSQELGKFVLIVQRELQSPKKDSTNPATTSPTRAASSAVTAEIRSSSTDTNGNPPKKIIQSTGIVTTSPSTKETTPLHSPAKPPIKPLATEIVVAPAAQDTDKTTGHKNGAAILAGTSQDSTLPKNYLKYLKPRFDLIVTKSPATGKIGILLQKGTKQGTNYVVKEVMETSPFYKIVQVRDQLICFNGVLLETVSPSAFKNLVQGAKTGTLELIIRRPSSSKGGSKNVAKILGSNKTADTEKKLAGNPPIPRGVVSASSSAFEALKSNNTANNGTKPAHPISTAIATSPAHRIPTAIATSPAHPTPKAIATSPAHPTPKAITTSPAHRIPTAIATSPAHPTPTAIATSPVHRIPTAIATKPARPVIPNSMVSVSKSVVESPKEKRREESENIQLSKSNGNNITKGSTRQRRKTPTWSISTSSKRITLPVMKDKQTLGLLLKYFHQLKGFLVLDVSKTSSLVGTIVAGDLVTHFNSRSLENCGGQEEFIFKIRNSRKRLLTIRHVTNHNALIEDSLEQGVLSKNLELSIYHSPEQRKIESSVLDFGCKPTSEGLIVTDIDFFNSSLSGIGQGDLVIAYGGQSTKLSKAVDISKVNISALAEANEIIYRQTEENSKAREMEPVAGNMFDGALPTKTTTEDKSKAFATVFTPSQLSNVKIRALPICYAFVIGDQISESLADKNNARIQHSVLQSYKGKKRKLRSTYKTAKRPKKPISVRAAQDLPDGWTEQVFERSATGSPFKYYLSPVMKFRFRTRKSVNLFLESLETTHGDENSAFELIKGKMKAVNSI